MSNINIYHFMSSGFQAGNLLTSRKINLFMWLQFVI